MLADYKTILEIVRTFNSECVPTPLDFIKERIRNDKRKDNFWRVGAISRIINEEAYIGIAHFKKSERIAIASDKTKAIPKCDWIRIPNYYEPIITQELFDKAHYCLKNPLVKKWKTKIVFFIEKLGVIFAVIL